MADEWDDDLPVKAPAAPKKQVSTNDEWDDSPAPAKPSNNGWQNNDKKKADDGWDDEPAPAKSNGKRKSDGWDDDDDWGSSSKRACPNGWSGGASKSNGDDWGSGGGGGGGGDRKSFTNRNNFGNDRPKRADWICSQCNARVFGSKSSCFKCQADKGDSQDAPPDDGNSRRGGGGGGGRPSDWICSQCNAKVFGSRSSCFKCSADKGDSQDAPPDDGNSSSSRGGRPSDWICSQCNAKVFGSKSSCFKCQADKGDSKDAPPDDGNSSSSRGGRASDWICSQCNAKVFGSKSSCFKCQADKGDSKDAPADEGSSWGKDDNNDSGARPKPGGKPGDWNCECGVSNYASRNECFKCSAAKPEGAGGGGDDKFNNQTNKEFYIPTEVEVDELFSAGISSGINFSKFNDIPVNSTDTVRNSVPKPCKTFKEAGLNDFLLENIEKSNYKTPTPIQQHGMPIISAGRDLMACAQTGSGKTAAFLLPMIHKLMTDNAPLNVGRPYVVIITPTRELCTQIYNEARKFAKGSIIKCCQIYGGTAVRHQNQIFNEGCHILVATPGRLKDFCDKAYVTFDNLKYFVLDEADRMLDMGFAPAVEEIMKVPSMIPTGKRQTLMFSATFPNEIQRLAGKYLHEYIFLTIGVVGGASSDVVQNVFQVAKFEKRNKLMEILNEEDPRGTMVFVETKRTADFLASFLSESEHPTTSIHGDRKQSQREEALADFKKGKMKVIIATSVAARGLDIPGVRHVVNYDIPKSIDDYVHRIGRTGRVGNVGKATSFFDPEQDAEIASELVRVLKDSNTKIPDFLANSSGGGGGGGGGSSAFGGTDFRQSKSAPPPAHGGGCDDEEW